MMFENDCSDEVEYWEYAVLRDDFEQVLHEELDCVEVKREYAQEVRVAFGVLEKAKFVNSVKKFDQGSLKFEFSEFFIFV